MSTVWPVEFRPRDEIERFSNRLPHWTQDQATYFVTFRLFDSLPECRLGLMRQQESCWRKLHPPPWDATTWSDYERLFREPWESWLDSGQGSCLLADPVSRTLLRESLLHFEGVRHAHLAFVIMPNHAHLLFRLGQGWSLDAVMHTWRRHSAKAINRHLGRVGPVWQRDYYDRIVRNQRHLMKCLSYIRRNPAKANLREDQFVLYENSLAGLIDPR